MHMAINDVRGRGMGVSCMRYFHEFLGHTFVSGLRALKPKKPKNFFLKT